MSLTKMIKEAKSENAISGDAEEIINDIKEFLIDLSRGKLTDNMIETRADELLARIEGDI